MWFFSIKCKIIFFESTRAGITMVLRQLVSIINSCTWWLLKIRSQLKSIFIYCHPVNSNNCQATILPQTSQWAKQQYFHKENRKQHYTIYRSVWPIWLFHVYLVAKQRLCNMSFTKSSLTKLEPVIFELIRAGSISFLSNCSPVHILHTSTMRWFRGFLQIR